MYGGPETVSGAMIPSWLNQDIRPKACFFSFIEEEDLEGILGSIQQIEKKFNSKFNYPWIFLTRNGLSADFQKTLNENLRADYSIGLVPNEYWEYPDFVNQEEAERERWEMSDLPDGDSLYARFKNRYLAGFFWKHPLLEEFDWYWRVEPNIRLNCEVDYDVFKKMQDEFMIYGTLVAKTDSPATSFTIWENARTFEEENQEFMSNSNFRRLFSNDGQTYNFCAVMSESVVVNLNFFRTNQFKRFFEYMDQKGGFFYERWSDSALHTIALALLTHRHSINIFDDIGYMADSYQVCPLDNEVWNDRNCECDQGDDFIFAEDHCAARLYDAVGKMSPIFLMLNNEE
ncbi:hypothetical protein NCAS_0A08540 [Naumovozyma castellii]|uniref:Glycosyltransferase family 15 protein n=1 Tax=Naumovozyma castellii TaxID=27288 RepID=G0V7G4_NAUCA|nr:hypothetical protein NCAS_0A08540 [Naumovozyma castellii CBS 4309]CCC67412.1 hypothetical protein NCAS_0A08540 [Naumovozyma castellii CBS 4309]